MPYIAVLVHTDGSGFDRGLPYAVAIQARDLDAAIAKAGAEAQKRTEVPWTYCKVVAVFDALAGAIGPDVDKEFD